MNIKSILKKKLTQSIFLLIAIGGVITVTTVVMSTAGDVGGIAEKTPSFVDSARPFRIGFLILLFLFWNHVSAAFGYWKKLSKERIEYLKSIRWRVLAYVVLFEFFVIESIPSKLLGG